ncbi:hypothetical protein ACPV30_01970 [Photobacterium damselae]|uniref:hypothetical protein n=1 Tax=Photobacterium damselae TaxID=38293 RepID=UPI004068BD13
MSITKYGTLFLLLSSSFAYSDIKLTWSGVVPPILSYLNSGGEISTKNIEVLRKENHQITMDEKIGTLLNGDKVLYIIYGIDI